MKKLRLLLLVLLGLGLHPPICAARTAIPRRTLERIKQATVFIVVRYVDLAALGKDTLAESDIRKVYNGSGFLMSKTGLILTNAHVVAPSVTEPPAQEEDLTRSQWAKRKTYVLYDVEVWRNCGRKTVKKYPAQVLCTRPFPLDLALIRIQPDEAFPEPPPMDPTLHFDPDRDAAETQDVWAVGFPLGAAMEDYMAKGFKFTKNPNGPDISIRKGSISSLRRGKHGPVKAIEHTCPIERGNSGGPLINVDGNIMGINSFGIGDRSFFAIPLSVIFHTFMPMLNLERYGNLFQSRKIRRATLTVNPGAAADGKTTFKTIRSALAQGQRGDTFKLAAGTFTLKANLQIPAGCKFIGAGRGRTILKQSGRFSPMVTVGAAAAFEMAGMSIKATRNSTALVVLTGAKGNTFLHDLDLTSETGWGLKVGGTADITNCRVESDNILRLGINNYPSGPGGQDMKILGNGGVRVTRTRLDGFGIVLGTSGVWDGCSGYGLIFSGSGTSATARGCYLKNFIMRDKAKGALKNSIMKEKKYLGVHSGATATFTGNFITQFSCLEVEGQGSTATVTGNYFKNMGGALWALKGATALFEKNTVDYSFGYPPRAIAVGHKNTECFGIYAKGSGTTVTCKGNLFSSSNDGHAFSKKDGGKITDGGGNTVSIK